MTIPVWPLLIYIGTGIAVLGTALLLLGLVALSVGNDRVSEALSWRIGLPILWAAVTLLVLGLFGWWLVGFVVVLIGFGWIVRPKVHAK